MMMFEALLSCVRQAGAAILQHYNAPVDVSFKADKSPVTAADLAAHHILLEGLKNLSHYPVLSEEGEGIDASLRMAWPVYWLVDPLDGTKEFLAKTGEFTVNVALVVAGQAVLGVVYAPITGALYWGALPQALAYLPSSYQGQGALAYKCQTNSAPQRLVCPLCAGSLRAVISRFHHVVDDALFRFVTVKTQTAIGSSLKMCLIAEGFADVYVRRGPTHGWDTAAAQVVLEAAGGHLRSLSTAAPLSYNQQASLVNPEFVAFGRGLALKLEDAEYILRFM